LKGVRPYNEISDYNITYNCDWNPEINWYLVGLTKFYDNYICK
jgi:hypothetical protein